MIFFASNGRLPSCSALLSSHAVAWILLLSSWHYNENFIVSALPTSFTSSSASEPVRTRALNSYAVYDLPPFGVMFTTMEYVSNNKDEKKASLVGNDPIKVPSSDVTVASWSNPLRRLTEEFLFESFQIQLSKSDIPESDLPELIRSLQTLDTNVIVYYYPQLTRTITPSLSSAVMSKVQRYYVVEFDIKGSFIEPVDPSTKPTNSQVRSIMGGWIQFAFLEDQTYYMHTLSQSSNNVLQEIRHVKVITDFDISEVTLDVAASSLIFSDMTLQQEHDVVKHISAQQHMQHTKQEDVLVLILVITILFVFLIMILFYCYRQRYMNKSVPPLYGGGDGDEGDKPVIIDPFDNTNVNDLVMDNNSGSTETGSNEFVIGNEDDDDDDDVNNNNDNVDNNDNNINENNESNTNENNDNNVNDNNEKPSVSANEIAKDREII